AMRARGVPTRLLIGPWRHSIGETAVGERTFGVAAGIDLDTLQLRWFDWWLKGQDTGVLAEAPIRLFVMGANTWRDEQEWPLARAVETRYYLHSRGHANSLNGDGTLDTHLPDAESPDQYAYDPANPVITHGGALLMTPEYPAGP